MAGVPVLSPLDPGSVVMWSITADRKAAKV